MGPDLGLPGCTLDRAASRGLGRAGAGDAGGALVRLAVLRARLGARSCNRSPNMWTLIAHRRAGGLRLQRRCRAGAGHLPARLPRCTAARSAVYFEAAAVIVVLVLLGQVLELRAREQTGNAIRALLEPRAQDRAAGRARRQRDARCRSTQVAGRRPAARAPGRGGPGRRRGASKAASAVDESMLTGEPVPVEKARGRCR